MAIFEASGSGDFDDEDFYPSPKPTESPVEKGGMGCSTKFFDSETSAFFGCISSWWVCTIALAMFIIIGCVLPKCFRAIKASRRKSTRRASITSTWMSSRQFFSCDRENMVPEYQRSVPKEYRSNYDISLLPDEVFEKQPTPSSPLARN
ncbi:Oidioi.mRNA.OKI2018_I69.chr1.g3548.t1.cds [Oikopleura dioica]|uniref:Oidioi.mRNA.OKI2018_I69.chr1.g3548.t1.cds n=1 Tax=Oikopleura dioica TaxID=34765 RepID=A0ABN7SUH2_OIKDI|nr:Oidioi.mRNA.OKI2018_I69.chr1.g3548.t1.cds [Oikopleura dioica]